MALAAAFGGWRLAAGGRWWRSLTFRARSECLRADGRALGSRLRGLARLRVSGAASVCLRARPASQLETTTTGERLYRLWLGGETRSETRGETRGETHSETRSPLMCLNARRSGAARHTRVVASLRRTLNACNVDGATRGSIAPLVFALAPLVLYTSWKDEFYASALYTGSQ